jgi:branched-chain amino acid transport system permease protein
MSDFFQLTFSGISLGFQYALVALSITVILRASGILNIFQGGMVLLGGYLTYAAHQQWHLPFVLAVLVALVVCAGVNAGVERLVLRRAGHASELAAVFLTFGLLLVLEQVVESIWGSQPLDMGDPWAFGMVGVAGLKVAERDVWTILLAAVALAGVYVLFSRTRLGLSMRANASDSEAASAQGIRPGTVLGVSWGLAGVLGALAGVLMSTNVGGGVRPDVSIVAFAALPAIYLGGAGSPLGAVVGGLAIGLAQQYAAGYSPDFLGNSFSTVFPYIVLVLVLIARPQGIFGTRAVRRA